MDTLDHIINAIIIINNITNNESLDHWHDDDLFVGLIYEILHTCSIHYTKFCHRIQQSKTAAIEQSIEKPTNGNKQAT